MANYINNRLTLFGDPERVRSWATLLRSDSDDGMDDTPRDNVLNLHPFVSGSMTAWDSSEEMLQYIRGSQAMWDFVSRGHCPVGALQKFSERVSDMWLFVSFGGDGPVRGRHIFRGGKCIEEIESPWPYQGSAQIAGNWPLKFLLEHEGWVADRIVPLIVDSACQ